MLPAFKDDYFWMLRESKGYIPWLSENGYKLTRLASLPSKKCLCHDHHSDPRRLMKLIAEGDVFENELMSLVFKSIVRAEARFARRYVPQRSHEERLTGSLVSELDNAISHTSELFREAAVRLYSEPRELDFFYSDLSKGGKLEKETGADLALILVVDLPDYPFTVKSIVLQAKKMNGGSVQLNKDQFDVLTKYGAGAAYLFYDMNLETLYPPFVLRTNTVPYQINNDSKSFMVDTGTIINNGYPLSFFMLNNLLRDNIGRSHASFDDANSYIQELCIRSNLRDIECAPPSRLAVVSIGGKIQYGIHNNETFRLSMDHKRQ